MYAMQYEMTLPADYDMQIIRDRVAAKGSVLDTFPGLGVKAFLIRERGVDGSPVNEYAPFYLWSDVAGMNAFLWGGGGFQGIVDSFGRPPVRHWTGVSAFPGAARGGSPTWASRAVEVLGAGRDITSSVAEAVQRASEAARQEEAHTVAVAVDPSRWEIITFSLMTGHAVPDQAANVYQVLHVCKPEIDALPVSSSVAAR